MMSLDQWHEVAVSYDADTGSTQMYVNGNIEFTNAGIMVQGVTAGPVVMGSRYYYTSGKDKSYFHGKIACMRLWNIARDLSTMRMDTPLCKII